MERDRYRGEPSSRFSQSPWNRPPPRSFNPRGINGRARTPSPGATYGHREPRSVDVRDRLDLDTRGGPSRAGWDHERERRWNGRDERFGDESRSMPNRRPSPTKAPYRERQASPGRWRSTSIPRNGPPPGRPPFAQRERDWERDRERERDRPGSGQGPPGPGSNRESGARSPGPSAYPIPSRERDRPFPAAAVSRPEAGAVSTRSSPGATSNGAARSVRGTSSPVMSRMPDPAPSSTAAAAPSQSDEVKSEPEEGELEEGEVLSPVRPQRDPVREPVDGISSNGWNRNWPRRSPPPPPTTNGGGIGHGRKPSNVPMPRGYRGRPPHVNGGDRDRDRERDRQWGQRQISPTKGPVDNGWDGFARRRVSAEEPGLGKAGQERSPLKSQREESPLIKTEENRLPDAQAVSEATTEPGEDRLREKDAAIARVAKAEPAVGSAESDLAALQVPGAESPPIVRDQKEMADSDGVSAIERSHWEEQGTEGHGRDEAARPSGRDDERKHTGSDTGSQAEAKPEPTLPTPDAAKHITTQQTETPPQTADGPIQLSEQEDDRPPTPERPPTPPLPAILDESKPVIGKLTPVAAETSVETVADSPVVAQLQSPITDNIESAELDSSRQQGLTIKKELDGIVTETAIDGNADDGRPEAAQTRLPPSADSNNNPLEDIAVQAGLISNVNLESTAAKDVDMEGEARTILHLPDEAKPAPNLSDATTTYTPAQLEPASLKPVSAGSDRTQAHPGSAMVAQDAETSTATRLPARRPRETRTLAERRSVQLPPTSGPLPATMQSDALPTAVSAVDSTDTEIWPEAVEVAEEVRDANIIASMKIAQMKDLQVDAEAIMAWNVEVSPVKSCRRVLTPKELKQITRSLDKGVSRRVAMQIAKEHVHNERRVERLREEYLTLDKDWQEHCRYLDELMELRGPPPESLYSIPNALPAVTPGPMPGTPATEEIGGRSRRRGALADAVNTEAEYQEILASFADTAAKDPNARALKTTAVVPDMLTPKERLMRHVDENDLVEDPLAFYDFDGLAEPVWTQEEEDIFKRRYLNYPKQFGKIADGIPTKSAGDCVLYYYRTKKEKNWKGQLAVRRGMSTLKRKAPLIKKGGKSAALLANLDAKKPTVDPTPVKSTANKEKDGAETPTDKAGKRKPKDARRKSTLDTPGAETDEVSEMKKIKGKAKRPRSSVIPDQSAIEAHALANAARGAGLAGEASTSIDPATTELLPPVKRRKHRKVQPEAALGPDGQPLPAEDKPVKPKRGGTNSYWTVPEKARCKELAMTYKTDYKTIASFMPDKTERQVINHMKEYLVEWKLVGPDGEKLGGPYSRSIYDVYNGANGPRLGVFPPLPRPDSHQATTSAHPLEQPSAEPPAQEAAPIHISRPGGMRISALLNDDPAPPAPARVDNTDNQSDATVDDTEDPRRSPRAYPTHAPSHAHTQQHDDPYAHAHVQAQPHARPGEYRSVSGGSVQYYRTSQTPHQQHVYDPHARERVMHYSEEPLQRAQTATPAYRYEYPHEAYPERAYSGHARVPPHSDAYQAMIAERAYNRANVAVDYRSPQPHPTYDERYYEERSRQERTYAAAAAMPPLHHPQPHLHSHMQPHAHSHPPQHSHLQAHPQAHPHPQPQPHSHSAHHHQTLPPARPPSAHSHAPSLSPHISHAHVPQVAHHVSPHIQAGMGPRRSPYEPERNSERLPSIHPGMDEQRRA